METRVGCSIFSFGLCRGGPANTSWLVIDLPLDISERVFNHEALLYERSVFSIFANIEDIINHAPLMEAFKNGSDEVVRLLCDKQLGRANTNC